MVGVPKIARRYKVAKKTNENWTLWPSKIRDCQDMHSGDMLSTYLFGHT